MSGDSICPCGRSPDPGIKPGGGCWCTEDHVPDRMELVADIIAAAFHDHYERLAPQYGYETREASRKVWGEVPEQNRALMRATVRSLIDAGLIEPPVPLPRPARHGTDQPTGGDSNG